MQLAGEFDTVPQRVRARRLFADAWHTIGGKRKFVPAGMWIVEVVGGNGFLLAIPDDRFREQFRPTDTYSENMWNEQTKTVRPIWPGSGPIDLNR